MYLSKHIKTRRILAILFFFILLSCSPAIKPSPPVSEETSTLIGATWEKLIRSDHMQDTMKALAQIEITSKFKRYPLKIALMLKRPSMMRIETIPVIGPTDFLLSLNNDAFKVFIPEKNAFYLGRPSQDNINFFLPINLAAEDLLSIMIGIPPVNGKKTRFEKVIAGKEYRIDLFADDHKIKTLVLGWENDGHLSGMEILDQYGETLNTVSYSNYHKVGESDLPYQITVFSREKNSTLTIRYSDVEFSKDYESFDLPIPPDVNPILMDRKNDSYQSH